MRAKKDLHIEVGRRIRNIREDMNLTREQLAEKIEASARFLSCVENGQSGISLETLQKLSVSLHVSTDYLLFGRKQNEIPQDIVDLLTAIPADYYDQLVKQIRLFKEIIDKK